MMGGLVGGDTVGILAGGLGCGFSLNPQLVQNGVTVIICALQLGQICG